MFGWLRKQKSESRTRPPISLRPRDCHSHIIPGVDDGSRSLEESFAMLRLLREAGAERVIATPHMFPGKYPNEPDRLRRAFDGLQTAATSENIALELELGSEHYLDEDFLTRIHAGILLPFGRERYILFETHTGDEAPVDLLQVVHELRHRDFTPLMAHVERYRYLRGESGRELCEDLRSAGARFQVNRTVGNVNVPGEGPRGEFLAWLQTRDFIDEVGSDLHRATQDGRPTP